MFNFQPNKSISDFDQPEARPRRWSRGSTQSLETEIVDTDLLRSDEKSYQGENVINYELIQIHTVVRQLIDKETGKRLEYNKLAAVPKIQESWKFQIFEIKEENFLITFELSATR